MLVLTAPWIRTKVGVPICSVTPITPESVITSSSVIVPVTIAWM